MQGGEEVGRVALDSRTQPRPAQPRLAGSPGQPEE
jgi:hypothetical protein